MFFPRARRARPEASCEACFRRRNGENINRQDARDAGLEQNNACPVDTEQWPASGRVHRKDRELSSFFSGFEERVR